MSALKRQQSSNLNESDEEDLSEREEENLEGILVLFPAREIKEESEFIEDDTFEKVKNLLTCPICLDIFTEPVLVKKCLHRFCKTCIERVIRG
jgi:Zinc finger, C3HC4 type (RING finger).